MTIGDLPENILIGHVFAYLSITERSRLLGLNRHLFFETKTDCEKNIQQLAIATQDDARLLRAASSVAMYKNSPEVAWPRRMLGLNLSSSLHTLDLTSHGTDGFLRTMVEQRLFPLLRCLSVRGSSHVTNAGLEWLSRHAGGNIETIDLTFCSNTTYGGTACLRERLQKSLLVLRRQPSWLDGQFHTPFHDDSGSRDSAREVHTYYPDGTFSFSRANQSRGFVAELSEWDSGEEGGRLHCVADRLQYTNFEPYPGWPSWTAYCYRPGVCLFPLPDEEREGGERVRSILVGQSLRALRPPRVIQDVVNQQLQQHGGEETTHLPSMTIGTSAYFIQDNDGCYVQSKTIPSDLRGAIMISRMRVSPLPFLTPPQNLVSECLRMCDMMKQTGEGMLNQLEDELNRLLGS